MNEPTQTEVAPPANRAPPFLVAGVGGSAGGLEAVTRLIAAIPADTALALIFVQHLSSDHESQLPELLAARTALRVEAARDGQRLTPGYLYVIQPSTQIAVMDGVLRLMPRSSERAHDAPIDRLFESMADGYGERAVGVVLSGAGRDGSLGLMRIRAVGGVTMAQQPDQAQVDSMPRSAIATGVIELVLPAEQLADELVRLSEDPFFRQELVVSSADEDRPGDAQESLLQVLQLLRRETGVDFSRYKQPTVQRRIRRRMALQRRTELPEYVQLLRADRSELEKLHDDILINVTSFFRDPGSFEALRSQLFPRLLENRQEGQPIRAWVPGCSSGEEAYSLAITLLDALGDQVANTPLLVFGTDLSQRMIDRARTGQYPESIAAEVPESILQRFFSAVDGGYRVDSRVRERCVFARQDITRDPPFSKLDIVLCRNVLIYLGQPAQAKVVSVFHYALAAEGALMLGRSETVGAQASLFSLVDARWKIYRRLPGVAATQDIEFTARAVPLGTITPEAWPQRVGLRSTNQELQTETNRLLLERYAPPAVVVDSKFMVVRSQGATGLYLELPSGEATLDVIKMIRPGLMSPLRSALQDAREQDAPVRKQELEFLVDGALRRVDLEVRRIGRSEPRHFMILFEVPRPTSSAEAPPPPASVDSPSTAPAISQLQQELADTRLHLQSMIQELETANEELQAANEEILSSNEELQSTNEELDTAREELQSSNEELSTVNDELQSRNGQLLRSNSDLLNLLGSVQIPIVMVTADLRIRMFTPAAERLLNLIGSDAGRPIGHIRPNISYPDLEQIIREVVESMTPNEREVQDGEGNTYIARIRPYKNFEQRIDGAVLALFDVTSTLKVARETGEAIMSTVRDPMLLLDSKLVVRRANRAFCDRFAIAETQAVEHSVFDLDGGRWHIPALRRLLEETLPERQNFQDFLVEQELPGGGGQRLLVDARRIESDRKGGGVILLIIRDGARA